MEFIEIKNDDSIKILVSIEELQSLHVDLSDDKEIKDKIGSLLIEYARTKETGR